LTGKPCCEKSISVADMLISDVALLVREREAGQDELQESFADRAGRQQVNAPPLFAPRRGLDALASLKQTRE